MRELSWRSIAEVEAELDRLEKSPLETHGIWSFAQILNHLALSAEYATGENTLLIPKDVPANDRPELGRKFFDRMVRTGKFPGVQNSAAPSVREEGDPAREMTRLRRALGNLKRPTDKIHAHFFFGELTRDEWEIWMAMHSAHHLSFVTIKG